MRSSSRQHNKSSGEQVAAQTAPKKASKEITLDELLSSRPAKQAALEPASRGYTSAFSRSANLGRSRPAMAAPPTRGSVEKKFSVP